MNCTDARRMITPYVKHELNDRDTEQFLNHVEHCKDCMEELDICFTMYRALELLECGNHQEYNFTKLLKENIRETRRRIFGRKVFRLIHLSFVFLAELLLILTVITGFEMRRGELEHNVFERAILMFRRPAGLREGEETEKQTEKGTEKRCSVSMHGSRAGRSESEPMTINTFFKTISLSPAAEI